MQVKAKPTARQTVFYLLPILIALGGVAQYGIMRSASLMIAFGFGESRQSPTSFESELNTNEVKVAQLGAGLRGGDVTGIIDETTRAAIKRVQQQDGLVGNGAIDSALFRSLTQKADGDWVSLRDSVTCKMQKTWNSFECFLIDQDALARVQQKLNVPQSGEFDLATRDAIQKFLVDRDPASKAPGELSASLLAQILGGKS